MKIYHFENKIVAPSDKGKGYIMARYNYYGNKQKIKNLKISLIMVSILAVLIIALSCITSGFINWNTDTWFGNETVCEHVFEDGACTECGELEVLEDVEEDVIENETENVETEDNVIENETENLETEEETQEVEENIQE